MTNVGAHSEDMLSDELGSKLVLSEEDGNPNPMLNPVVLKRLFEVCDASDLHQFRLVSRDWHSLSLAHCRKEMTVKIHRMRKMKKSRFPRSEKWLNWETFGDQLEVGDNPFRSIRILDITFGSPSEQPMYRNMEGFWANYGANLVKLELDQSKIFSVEAFKNVIFEGTPNLEELKLVNLRSHKLGFHPPEDEVGVDEVVKVQPNLRSFAAKIEYFFPVTWSRLFSHFPNIQRLELDGFECGIFSDINTSLVDPLQKLLEVNKEHRITHLKLATANTSHESSPIKRLLQLPLFKLSSLDINTVNLEDEERSVLAAALQRHRPTLEKLRVHVHAFYFVLLFGEDEEDFVAYYDFPFCENDFSLLTELELAGPVSVDLQFLEKMPNLKKLRMLEFNNDIFNETDWFVMEEVRLLHLKDVTFRGGHISEDGMEILVRVMPNMERFNGAFDDATFRVVCENWSKLRELIVTSGFDAYGGNILPEEEAINDEAITGMVEGEEERLPNITDLKCLEKLEMATAGEISDVSVWNGFLQLPMLRRLCVRLTQETSDEAFQALLKHCPEGSQIRAQLSTSDDDEDNSGVDDDDYDEENFDFDDDDD